MFSEKDSVEKRKHLIFDILEVLGYQETFKQFLLCGLYRSPIKNIQILVFKSSQFIKKQLNDHMFISLPQLFKK